jgi:uncharacterized protein (DUF488 family)
MDKKSVILTMGTGLRSFEDFIEILLAYGVEAVIDVRSYPRSKLPHFTSPAFPRLLEANEIRYYGLGKELGGFRKGGYTAYLVTEEFRGGIRSLEAIARDKLSVIVCAEKFPWKCHRKWIALELRKLGWEVRHIIDKGKVWIPQ